MNAVAHLEKVEGLFQFDPIGTYAERSAERIAEIAGAHAWQLVLDHQEVARSHPGSIEATAEYLRLPLRSGKGELGTLTLAIGDELSASTLELIQWCARSFARGLGYTERLAVDGARRTGEEVADTVARAPLTPRERDVVTRLVGGFSTREIAEQTGLAVSTINTYLKRIFAKLGVHSRVELVARMAGTDRASRPPSQRAYPSRSSHPPAPDTQSQFG